MHQHRQGRRVVSGAVTAVASLALVACGPSGQGEDPGAAPEDDGSAAPQETADPAAELEGERMTIVVPYDPGGGFDTFVRLLEPYLEEELNDVEVEVENQPGGGGLIGANAVFQAQPDGQTIGLVNYPGAVFAELTETEGATFDNDEWTHLGRLGALPPLVYSGPDSQYATFEDVLEAEEEVVFGLGGVGSDAYYAAVVLGEVFGFPHKIVGGYPGSGEADAALLVGEIDLSINSGGAGVQMVEGSGAQPLVMISNEPMPELPDVPLIGEFAPAEGEDMLTALASMYDLERIMVGPPGMDEALADYIAEAIHTAASNSEYATEMEAAGYPVNPLPRGETVKLAERTSSAVDQLGELLQGQ